MAGDRRSPRITRFTWGQVEVEGAEAPYRDAMLYPGGSCYWDWEETGTHHAPGIQPVDVEPLLERGATVLVLSRGMHERLQVCPETLQMLRERRIPVEVLPTGQAVERYNQLSETEPVGALIHSTC